METIISEDLQGCFVCKYRCHINIHTFYLNEVFDEDKGHQECLDLSVLIWSLSAAEPVVWFPLIC